MFGKKTVDELKEEVYSEDFTYEDEQYYKDQSKVRRRRSNLSLIFVAVIGVLLYYMTANWYITLTVAVCLFLYFMVKFTMLDRDEDMYHNVNRYGEYQEYRRDNKGYQTINEGNVDKVLDRRHRSNVWSIILVVALLMGCSGMYIMEQAKEFLPEVVQNYQNIKQTCRTVFGDITDSCNNEVEIRDSPVTVDKSVSHVTEYHGDYCVGLFCIQSEDNRTFSVTGGQFWYQDGGMGNEMIQADQVARGDINTNTVICTNLSSDSRGAFSSQEICGTKIEN